MKLIEAVALDKFSEKYDRKDLAPGTYHVDFVVRVVGAVTVGNDYNQKVVAKADPWKLLAAAFSHLNEATINSLVRESLNADENIADCIKKSANEAIAKIKESTVQTCNGKITTRLVAIKQDTE